MLFNQPSFANIDAAETELWREERSQSAVQRELLVKSTLQRRGIPTPLCEFVCGVREVRIGAARKNKSRTGNDDDEGECGDSNNNKNDKFSKLNNSNRNLSIKASSSTRRIDSSSASFVSSSSTTPTTTTTRAAASAAASPQRNNEGKTQPQSHVFHRLKYFSTRSSLAPLAIPLNGAVDKPDARYQDVVNFFGPSSDYLFSSSSSSSSTYFPPTLSGKAVRTALKNLIGQVAQIHSGGCSHNNISLHSVCCLVANANNNSNNNDNTRKFLIYQNTDASASASATAGSGNSPSVMRKRKLIQEASSPIANSSVCRRSYSNTNELTFLLTRFDYATEFLTGDASSQQAQLTSNSSNDLLAAAPAFSSTSVALNSNNNSNNVISSPHSLLNLKRVHRANLAIAPNILALTATFHEQSEHYYYYDSANKDSKYKNNNSNNDNSSMNNNASPSSNDSVKNHATNNNNNNNTGAPVNSGSAEKIYRLFQQRQQAELINRAQGRRPLPLSIPSCGPVCDVQGLVAITTVLFRHLLEAGDDVFARPPTGSDQQRQQYDSPQQHQHQQHQHQHRFWTCDVDTFLKKYIIPPTTATTCTPASSTGSMNSSGHQLFLDRALEWLRERTFSLLASKTKTEEGKNSYNDSNHKLGSDFCAFKVIDEGVASPQLAAFRIESLAGKSVSGSSNNHDNNNNNINDNNSKMTTSPSSSPPPPLNKMQLPTTTKKPTLPSSMASAASLASCEIRCAITTCSAPAVELRWLLSRVLCQFKLPLPDAGQLQVHPFFWSSRRTAQFVVACAQFFCEDALIDETLKSFCQWPPSSSSSSTSTSTSPSIAPASPASLSSLCAPSSSQSNANRTVSIVQQLQNQQVQQQYDPDGVAVRHAEKLRLSLRGGGAGPFSRLGTGMRSTSSMIRAHPLYRELYGGTAAGDDGEQGSGYSQGDDDGDMYQNDGSDGSGQARRPKSAKSKKRNDDSSLSINISPIRREQSMLLKNMFGAGSASDDLKSQSSFTFGSPSSTSLLSSLSPSVSFSKKKSSVTPTASFSFRSKRRTAMMPTSSTTSSPSSSMHSSHPGRQRHAHDDGDDDDENSGEDEQPPNCLAKELGCSSTIVWWGKGEFRADASSHKDNAAVWLRMLTDIVGSSQHPFSIVNTQSGRIRNARSDLLLFIAVLIARMLEGASPRFGGKNVKICGGDAFEFVSIAVHSRFPGLQMILIELLSRRLTDATKFCQFIAEQEMLLRRGVLASSNHGKVLPLFAATQELWVSSKGREQQRSFSEECAEMFRFWS